MDIRDKAVIVTGASAGIGLATAKLLARHGAKVALVARSQDAIERAAKGLPGAAAITADMSNPDDIIAMVEKAAQEFGRIDILVNNAGQGYDTPVEKIHTGTFHTIINLDLIGPVIAMQQVIPLMRQQDQGSIINISSGTALMHLPNMGAYSCVKAALAHLSLTAREELKTDHINVSVIYPYITQTDFEKNTIKNFVATKSSGKTGAWQPPAADSADYVAGLVLDCIKNGPAEVYAYDWMRRNA